MTDPRSKSYPDSKRSVISPDGSIPASSPRSKCIIKRAATSTCPTTEDSLNREQPAVWLGTAISATEPRHVSMPCELISGRIRSIRHPEQATASGSPGPPPSPPSIMRADKTRTTSTRGNAGMERRRFGFHDQKVHTSNRAHLAPSPEPPRTARMSRPVLEDGTGRLYRNASFA